MKIFRLFVALTLVCFALLPTAQAVVPTPYGGYPGLNRAEGKNTLLSLDMSTGVANTAVGWFSLTTDVNGSFNTGVGAGTLLLNVGDPTTGDGRMELGVASQLWIARGERSGLLMRIAAMESIKLCARMKS